MEKQYKEMPPDAAEVGRKRGRGGKGKQVVFLI